MKKDGPTLELDVYAFMTTEPNELTASINHERMPVPLSKEAEFETRLRGTPEEALGLLGGYEERDSFRKLAGYGLLEPIERRS